MKTRGMMFSARNVRCKVIPVNGNTADLATSTARLGTVVNDITYD